MKDSVNIGLIGFGTIGSGVVETFNQNLGICKPKKRPREPVNTFMKSSPK